MSGIEDSLERLQERLDGVYDLTKVKDCRAVIDMLLRDLDKSNMRTSAEIVKMRSLALAVANDRFDAKEKAKEVLSSRQRDGGHVMEFLASMAEEMKQADALDDESLAAEVLNTTWANLDMDSRESAVLSELIGRFKKLKGCTDVKAKST